MHQLDQILSHNSTVTLPSRCYNISVIYNNFEFITHSSARCITISSASRNNYECSRLIRHIDFDFVSFIVWYRVTQFISVNIAGIPSCTNSRIPPGVITRYPIEWSFPTRADTGISKFIWRWCRTNTICSRKPKGQTCKSN